MIHIPRGVEIGIPFFFLLVILYALFARKLDRLSVTMPMVFVAVGALLGPYGLGFLLETFEISNFENLIEITLALLLFADASTLSFQQIKEDRILPARLLLIGMPLTIALGGLIAMLIFPAEGIGFALLLGTILAPTDAALGWPIFTNENVPVRMRRALSVESGLNDGIATPLVTLFTALAVAESSASAEVHWPPVLLQIAIAVGVAIIVGWGGGLLFAQALRRGWTSKLAQQIGGVALALAAYSGSISLGGNGFIAAFVAGLLLGFTTRGLVHEGLQFTETTGALFSLFVWTVFGAVALGAILPVFNPLAFLYAILALTLIRIVPVVVATLGLKLRRDSRLIMGWFGPRGLASVVFTLIALETFQEAGRQIEVLVAMAAWTIVLSVILHGITAVPMANWYAKRLRSADPSAPEFSDLADLHIRRQNLVGALPKSTQ
jgi:NhaP-type Na+/H+ or K+/H+ antiporter